jgi:UDP-glucose:(heptosyl)LPS alpha-1,3-glucosyltransferase
MKIAVVIPSYGLVGGAENFAFHLCEILSGHEEFEIHVFANRWYKGEAPVVFHKVPRILFPRFLRPIVFAYFAQKQIQQGGFDLIHSHDRIFKMDLLTMHAIPHKTWIQETRQKSMSLFDRATAWVEEKGFQSRPIVLPVSTLVKKELLRLYGFSESHVHVVHPGASPERFNVLHREKCRREVRRRHGLAPEDTIILFVGMNFEIKRLGLVLGGLSDWVSQGDGHSPVKLLVVGKGKKQPYLKMARDMGIADHVTFAGVTDRVEDYYMASDIFTMPSIFDTFGIAVLEAMMAHLPVIISSTVGAKDLIVHGQNGLVLPDNPTSGDMAHALGILMTKENRMKMGEKARQTAQGRTWQKTAREVSEIYRQFAGF